MAETAHTPGSWINANGLVSGRDSRPEYPDTPSIDIFDASEWPENLSEEAQANARLIAAAPTMFEYVDAKARSGCEEAISILEKINGS